MYTTSLEYIPAMRLSRVSEKLPQSYLCITLSIDIHSPIKYISGMLLCRRGIGMHCHFTPLDVILLSRPVLLHLHLVVHISHLRAPGIRIVMLDQQWQACASAFLRACSPSGSEQTIAAYQRVLAHFFRDRDPQKVTRRDVEDFLHAPANPHRFY